MMSSDQKDKDAYSSVLPIERKRERSPSRNPNLVPIANSRTRNRRGQMNCYVALAASAAKNKVKKKPQK